MSVYNFRDGPSYAAATREEMFTAAMDLPMNSGATFWDQAKGGTLESFGLGTAIRGAAIPPGDTSQLSTMDQIGRTAQSVMPGGVVGAIGGAIRRLTDEPSPVLSEDAYKASPFFRDDVPWDASMTEDRAAALASWHDAKAVRQYFATKRPITAFLGNVAGQAFDPINYIPVVGPAVQAAAAARAGRVLGTAATASADAALNTAIAGMATAGQRAQFGDDVSWQAMITEIATAALIGAGFGGIAGGIDARRAAGVDAAVRERLSTLQTTQEARIALNEGIDALAKGEDINLSPNATAGVERLFTVYHGSPHTFDAFSVDRIGTGEGAQAYGHGLYFAESEGVARSYRDQLAGDFFVTPNGETFDPFTIQHLNVRSMVNRTGDAAAARDKAKALIANANESTRPMLEADIATLDRVLMQGGLSKPEGNLYEVAIKANPDDFLDWDKPLSEQTGKAKEYVENLRALGEDIPPGDATGADLYKYFSDAQMRKSGIGFGRDGAFASREFAREGIPGIKYLDAGSRGEGEGSRNYVVFDDATVQIRARNGRPIDTSPPRPEPIPEGRAEAEKTLTRADDYAALKAQYRVDPETGDFLESAEIDQLRAEGRLTDEDIAALDAAQAELDNGTAYGDALKAAVACII